MCAFGRRPCSMSNACNISQQANTPFVTELKVSQHHLIANDTTISNKYFLKYKDMQEQQSADVPDSHTFEMYAVPLTVNLHYMGHGK